jgi:putative DNA primase/helicase
MTTRSAAALLKNHGIKYIETKKGTYTTTCPQCEGGYLNVKITRDGVAWYCHHCEKGGGEKFEQPDRTASRQPQKHTQAERAAWLWSQRKPIVGSIVERYLRQARGYSGPLPPTLAFLAPSKPEHHPAMIAAFAVPDEPEPGILGQPRNVDAVHLTLLKPGGSKADVEPNKKFVGSPRGRPIVLAPPNDLLGLAITEGIEDALSIYQATGLGVWAAGSAGAMPALAAGVASYIECITIFAHDDRGKPKALELADALIKRGIEVLVEGIVP